MRKILLTYVAGTVLVAALSLAQQAAPLIGTVTSVDAASQSLTVKQDKTGKKYTAELAGTKTILSVPPGTKPADLKKAAKRISAADIQPGDRVEVFYTPPVASGNTIAARAAIVMSAHALEAAHSAEASAWRHSTAGVVAATDPSAHTVTVDIRSPGGKKSVTVTTSAATQLTRYSVGNTETPAPAQLSDMQPGDIVRVIGQRSADGSAIAAQRIYIAPQQLPAVVVSVSAANHTLTVKDLRNKHKMVVAVNSRTQIRKLQPRVAQMLARRLKPELHGQGRQAGEPGQGGHGGAQGATDLSHIIESAPQISLGDLKHGDAVVISGVTARGNPSELAANMIVAGVEPIFQSAPPRRGQALGRWSLGMSPPPAQ
ncbi:MAG: DUF5666 domain-containing protein [Bryobacteraceae bacterium]